MHARLDVLTQVRVELTGIYQDLPAAGARIFVDEHLPRSRPRMLRTPDVAVVREHQVTHPLTTGRPAEIDESRTTIRLAPERQPKPGPG